MKKFYLLFLSLFLSWEMIAQVTIQGIPRNDIEETQTEALKSVKNLKPSADESFSFDDIQYWIGEGSKRAALVVQWNDGKNPETLVWGYKWDDTAYGVDMVEAIAKADPRFYILEYSGTAYGTAIGGLGFDIDQKNTVALILDENTTYPKYPQNGAITTGSYNFDDWTAFDTNDHWQSGWYSKGYWSYWVKENGGSYGYSGLGASSRELKDGSWDAWSFMPEFSGGDLSNSFTAVPPYSAQPIDYTKGIFFINEDWFGHTNGSVNFLSENGNFVYRAYSKENDNYAFGSTTQYGTIYGDNFYFISKQAKDGGDMFYTPGGRLVVADAKTLKKKAGFDTIGDGDGRSFLGVDENTGYIGSSNGIYIFDIKNLSVGNLIEGTGGGSSYSGQIGNMIRTSQYVLAVKQSTGLLVIDPVSHSVIRTIPDTSFNTLTQSKDGNVWIGAGSKLIKLNPVTFDTEEIDVSSVPISGSWGAWNAGSLCNSIKENVIYWKYKNKIVKYSIDTKTLTEDLATLPGQEETYKQIFYGAGLRVDPVTDNLIVTTTESGYGSHYQKNWVHIFNNTGNLINTYQLDDYYWFPALPTFPDNYAPEIISSFATSPYNISQETVIELKGVATDQDNLDAAIVKSIKETDNQGIISYYINTEEQLIITPLKKGTAVLEVGFNSNGKTVSQPITIQVASVLGTEEINSKQQDLKLYPNPFTDYFFVETSENSKLSIYSLNGQLVYEQTLNSGKNQVNASHLKSGIYLVKANNKTYKIIKR